MGIRKLFHKIGVGFARLNEESIPNISGAKRHGDWSEDAFCYHIRTHLPNCQIKRNIVIRTLNGNAEIDCLILYHNKLFAVEIKSWMGEIVERNGQFVQCKIDPWTNDRHTINHKSPFRQLARAIHLLKEQTSGKAWINSIVYFEDADKISTNCNDVWFDDLDKLTAYIIQNGKATFGNQAQLLFDKCIPADYLHSKSPEISLRCVICDDSLMFQTRDKTLNRSDISTITIKHHRFSDDLTIKTHHGNTYNIKLENKHIEYFENDILRQCALCKLDYIKLGDRK